MHDNLESDNLSRLSEKRLVSDYEITLQTVAWLARRQIEITLFRYLQDAANQLSSMSTEELSDAAQGFLGMLTVGLSRNHQAGDTYLVSKNGVRSECI